VAILLCYSYLYLVVISHFFHVNHLLAAKTTKLNPSATQEDKTCKLFDKISQPETQNFKGLQADPLGDLTPHHYAENKCTYQTQSTSQLIENDKIT
jgi:hypothetical protein